MEARKIRKVLLVDDNEDTLKLVKLSIITRVPDIEIVTATTSKEAVEKFNADTFQAIILDVSLPDMTGAYLGGLIRNNCPDIPIAFLTNYGGEVTKENADIINAEFWYKPDLFKDTALLATKVISLLEGEHCENLNKITIPSIIKNTDV